MSAGQDLPLPRRRSRQYQVVTAGTAHTDVLSQVIADVFTDLPQSEWLIGDPDARRQILPGYFLLLIEAALTSGTVYTTTDRAGAALWMHVSPDRTSPSDDYATRLAAATGRWASRFAAFDAVLDRHHPSSCSYDLLAILAVHPDRQGQGIGSALLRAHHQVLDRGEGTLGYLDAAGPRSRQLYRRHGYLPSGLFYLPEDGPAMYPMARPPQSGAPWHGTSASTPTTSQGTSVPRTRPAPETTS